MNAYFENNGSFNSNKRIIEACFTEAAKPVGLTRRIGELLLSMPIAFFSAITSAKTKSFLKLFSVAASLCGFVGVIGAMERGTLGLGAGLLIGMLLVAIEFLCLRRHQH